MALTAADQALLKALTRAAAAGLREVLAAAGGADVQVDEARLARRLLGLLARPNAAAARPAGQAQPGRR
jgi:hypothetical protein